MRWRHHGSQRGKQANARPTFVMDNTAALVEDPKEQIKCRCVPCAPIRLNGRATEKMKGTSEKWRYSQGDGDTS
jgi:hypothetical protein